jgi:hypothetical protein
VGQGECITGRWRAVEREGLSLANGALHTCFAALISSSCSTAARLSCRRLSSSVVAAAAALASLS